MINFSITSLIFIPVLFYPPLLFSEQITAAPRIGLFILLIIYLSLATKRFQKKDLFIFTLFVILFSSMFTVNFGNSDGLRTVGNVTLTLLFAYALKRAVEVNDRVKNNLVKAYRSLFIVVPMSSVASVIYFIMFGEFSLFGIKSEALYNYIYTPFGVMLDRNLFGFNVYRSFFFFTEPVYLALFYAANVFFVAPYIKEKRGLFFYANVVGGILTFSYLFFIYVALFLVIQNKTLSRNNALRVLLIVCLIISTVIFNLFSASSLSVRMYAIDLFVTAMKEANVLQWMFGRGFMAYEDIGGNFSGGLFSTVYEVGVINLTVVLLFTFVLSNKSRHLFLLFFVAMLVFEPIKLPLFWVLVVVLTVFLPDRSRIKSASIS